MKQITALILAFAVLVSFIPVVGADNTATIDITLNNSATASIYVTPTAWGPTAGIGETEETDSGHFVLANNGTVTVDVTIKGSNTSNGWYLGTSPEHDTFHIQYNLTVAGSWQDILIAESPFANTLSPVTGENTRAFDLKLEMPTSSSNEASQSTQVTFTATAN